ncbi:hypothetical protein [Paenibacillus sp. TH7-28]
MVPSDNKTAASHADEQPVRRNNGNLWRYYCSFSLAQKIAELLVPIWEPDLEKASLSPHLPTIAVKNSFILAVTLTFGENNALFFRYSTALGSLDQLWPPQLNLLNPSSQKTGRQVGVFLPCRPASNMTATIRFGAKGGGIGCCPYFIFQASASCPILLFFKH